MTQRTLGPSSGVVGMSFVRMALALTEMRTADAYSPLHDPKRPDPSPSPDSYVVRTDGGTWVITDFDEDVATLVEDAVRERRGLLGLQEVMDALHGDMANTMVSLILSEDGGDVEWIYGGDVDQDMIEEMEPMYSALSEPSPP